uniref:Uncharacterized protein n=1 Tax=Pipistrellus kuhlii TaxID=59472 RepID=A0A7J7XAU9_PIPKU|nr:hypothetical protein mPipKuh1_010575 [Pipistrellus kuhlii]
MELHRPGCSHISDSAFLRAECGSLKHGAFPPTHNPTRRGVWVATFNVGLRLSLGHELAWARGFGVGCQGKQDTPHPRGVPGGRASSLARRERIGASGGQGRSHSHVVQHVHLWVPSYLPCTLTWMCLLGRGGSPRCVSACPRGPEEPVCGCGQSHLLMEGLP